MLGRVGKAFSGPHLARVEGAPGVHAGTPTPPSLASPPPASPFIATAGDLPLVPLASHCPLHAASPPPGPVPRDGGVRGDLSILAVRHAGADAQGARRRPRAAACLQLLPAQVGLAPGCMVWCPPAAAGLTCKDNAAASPTKSTNSAPPPIIPAPAPPRPPPCAINPPSRDGDAFRFWLERDKALPSFWGADGQPVLPYHPLARLQVPLQGARKLWCWLGCWLGWLCCPTIPACAPAGAFWGGAGTVVVVVVVVAVVAVVGVSRRWCAQSQCALRAI